MDLVKLFVLAGGLGTLASTVACAEEFSLTIGGAVASQDFAMKSAAFAIRANGCADPDKPAVTASAEGLVNGERKSIVLRVTTSAKNANVYAIPESWPPAGNWVVNLKGTCGKANAGAIVPIGPKGFLRESAKFFPRAATDAEVEASLKALSQSH